MSRGEWERPSHAQWSKAEMRKKNQAVLKAGEKNSENFKGVRKLM